MKAYQELLIDIKRACDKRGLDWHSYAESIIGADFADALIFDYELKLSDVVTFLDSLGLTLKFTIKGE